MTFPRPTTPSAERSPLAADVYPVEGVEPMGIPTTSTTRSLGAMAFASIISAVCGVVQVFWIPRVLSVDDFGRWRAFLLYAGYMGLLHLGLVDGALLLWSRQGKSPARSMMTKALRFVVVEHFTLIALAGGLLFLHPPHAVLLLAAALAGYALLYNLSGLLQVYLQSHLRFHAVATGMSVPGVVFVLLLGVVALTHATVGRLLVAYLCAWAVGLAVLLVYALRTPAKQKSEPATTGLAYIAAGWPIILTNTGFGLMQSADRVTVNITRPIHDFAIYSLSQSTIYVPITLLAAISRVMFSHFARTADEGRASIYSGSTRTLTMLWMLLLPYYFAVEWVVHRFLPKYVLGLESGRILLFSVLYISLVQVVQIATFSLAGRQRQFFLGAVVAVAVAFATAWIGSRVIGTLTAVAWSQVLTALLWWIGNELLLRGRARFPWKDTLLVVGTFALSCSLLMAVQAVSGNLVLDGLLYTMAAVPFCWLAFRPQALSLLRQLRFAR